MPFAKAAFAAGWKVIGYRFKADEFTEVEERLWHSCPEHIADVERMAKNSHEYHCRAMHRAHGAKEDR
jgi:hypothetical protein